MTVTVKYSSMQSRITKTTREVLEVPESSTVHSVVMSLSEKYGDEFKNISVDKDGNIKFFTFVNHVSAMPHYLLKDNDLLLFFYGIHGG